MLPGGLDGGGRRGQTDAQEETQTENKSPGELREGSDGASRGFGKKKGEVGEGGGEGGGRRRVRGC